MVKDFRLESLSDRDLSLKFVEYEKDDRYTEFHFIRGTAKGCLYLQSITLKEEELQLSQSSLLYQFTPSN